MGPVCEKVPVCVRSEKGLEFAPLRVAYACAGQRWEGWGVTTFPAVLLGRAGPLALLPVGVASPLHSMAQVGGLQVAACEPLACVRTRNTPARRAVKCMLVHPGGCMVVSGCPPLLPHVQHAAAAIRTQCIVHVAVPACAVACAGGFLFLSGGVTEGGPKP